MNLFGFIFVAAGIFCTLGAVLNWDWFMEHRKARFLSSILTRTGARFLYVVLGAGLTVVGLLVVTGVTDIE